MPGTWNSRLASLTLTGCSGGQVVPTGSTQVRRTSSAASARAGRRGGASRGFAGDLRGRAALTGAVTLAGGGAGAASRSTVGADPSPAGGTATATSTGRAGRAGG